MQCRMRNSLKTNYMYNNQDICWCKVNRIYNHKSANVSATTHTSPGMEIMLTCSAFNSKECISSRFPVCEEECISSRFPVCEEECISSWFPVCEEECISSWFPVCEEECISSWFPVCEEVI